MGRGPLLGLAALAMAMLTATIGFAEGVTWDIEVGFGGVYRSGGWTPVAVNVANDGPAVTGTATLPIRDPGSSYPVADSTRDYLIRLDLPQNSKKRYTACVPSASLREATLTLPHSSEKKPLTGLRDVSGRDLLAVVVGSEPGTLQFLDGQKVVVANSAAADSEYDYAGGMPGGGGMPPPPPPPPSGYAKGGGSPAPSQPTRVAVGHSAWDALPELWLGWEGVNAVVVADAGLSGASERSADALLSWVRLGGTVIVPGGALAPAIAASSLGALLPMDVSGTRAVPDLAALGAWCGRAVPRQTVLVATGNLRPGAVVLCGPEPQPLITSRKAGAGHVIFTSFDFTAQPTKYWDGAPAMWGKILASAPAARVLRSRRADASLSSIVTEVAQARLPSMWLMVGFLVAYVIVLVPGNYFLLKRMDRRELAWVTVPAIVAVFTVGAYGTGCAIRGKQVILNRLGVIEAEAGSGLGRGGAFLGLFSPGRRSYDIQIGDRAGGISAAEDSDDRHRQAQADLICGPQPAINNIRMNMWTSRAFQFEFVTDLKQGITGSAEYDGKTLTAKVTNQTGLPITKCVLIGGSGRGEEKALPADQEVTLSATPAARAPAPGYPKAGGYGPRRLPPSEPDEGRTRDIGQAAFDEVCARGGQGNDSSGPSPGPIAVALCDGALVPATLVQSGATVVDHNILAVRLPVSLSAGARLTVPAWLIGSRIVERTAGADSSGSRYGSSSYATHMLPTTGSYVTVEFQLPPAQGELGAKHLALRPTSGGGMAGATGGGGMPGVGGGMPGGGTIPGMPGAPSPATGPPGSGYQLLGYDFARDRWQPLPVNSAGASYPYLDGFISRDGRMLVKVQATQANVTAPYVFIEAEVTVSGGRAS